MLKIRSFTGKMDDHELALSLQKAYDMEKASYESMNDSDLEIIEDHTSSSDLRNHDESLDYAIALSLEEDSAVMETPASSKQEQFRAAEWDPRQIVSSNWELVDPNPNIHDLYVKYDAMFFNSTLTNRGVAVNWSSRMTL